MSGGVFKISKIKDRPGYIVFKVSGKNVEKIFRNEPGGHRWQRIPPTERKGRRHTSTITVAVLKEFKDEEVKLTHHDVTYKATRASGKGGQKRNKVHTAVQLTHKGTGLRVDCCEGVSQRRNRNKALKRMEKRLNKSKKKQVKENRAKIRKEQVGSGMRGDKIRTVQCHNNKVKNHLNGKEMSYKKYAAGYIEEIH